MVHLTHPKKLTHRSWTMNCTWFSICSTNSMKSDRVNSDAVTSLTGTRVNRLQFKIG